MRTLDYRRRGEPPGGESSTATSKAKVSINARRNARSLTPSSRNPHRHQDAADASTVKKGSDSRRRATSNSASEKREQPARSTGGWASKVLRATSTKRKKDVRKGTPIPVPSSTQATTSSRARSSSATRSRPPMPSQSTKQRVSTPATLPDPPKGPQHQHHPTQPTTRPNPAVKKKDEPVHAGHSKETPLTKIKHIGPTKENKSRWPKLSAFRRKGGGDTQLNALLKEREKIDQKWLDAENQKQVMNTLLGNTGSVFEDRSTLAAPKGVMLMNEGASYDSCHNQCGFYANGRPNPRHKEGIFSTKTMGDCLVEVSAYPYFCIELACCIPRDHNAKANNFVRPKVGPKPGMKRLQVGGKRKQHIDGKPRNIAVCTEDRSVSVFTMGTMGSNGGFWWPFGQCGDSMASEEDHDAVEYATVDFSMSSDEDIAAFEIPNTLQLTSKGGTRKRESRHEIEDEYEGDSSSDSSSSSSGDDDDDNRTDSPYTKSTDASTRNGRTPPPRSKGKRKEPTPPPAVVEESNVNTVHRAKVKVLDLGNRNDNSNVHVPISNIQHAPFAACLDHGQVTTTPQVLYSVGPVTTVTMVQNPSTTVPSSAQYSSSAVGTAPNRGMGIHQVSGDFINGHSPAPVPSQPNVPTPSIHANSAPLSIPVNAVATLEAQKETPEQIGRIVTPKPTKPMTVVGKSLETIVVPTAPKKDAASVVSVHSSGVNSVRRGGGFDISSLFQPNVSPVAVGETSNNVVPVAPLEEKLTQPTNRSPSRANSPVVVASVSKTIEEKQASIRPSSRGNSPKAEVVAEGHDEMSKPPRMPTPSQLQQRPPSRSSSPQSQSPVDLCPQTSQSSLQQEHLSGKPLEEWEQLEARLQAVLHSTARPRDEGSMSIYSL
eukprot:Nitzschia sp. Nitz4//scaffold424_size9595//4069//6714//NITZ4_009092-RA/size9595-processed-gene-0.7-mRNA-1//1//CDS//3329551595//3627//frame0